jgi:arginine/lysine/ornithine decarboxylase
MAKLVASFAEMIEARPAVSLHLHTPAHQGRGTGRGLMPSQVFARDLPYFTRSRLAAFENKIASHYNTKQTICLTSGTTTGCLASVLALSRRHRSVWVVRNCHKSIVNGMILSGLAPRFLRPEGAVPTADELESRFTAAEAEAARAGSEAPTAIIFTNPTFEGWGMDIAACVEVCRRHGLEIVVDESHGSHWPASPALPQSALGHDVDIVMHSLHKYTGALVQTALVHLPLASRLTPQEMSHGLDLLETTTLSNLLLLSLERAVDRLFDPATSPQIARLVDEMAGVRRRQHNGDGLLRAYVPEGAAVGDPLKLFLTTEHAGAEQVARWFYEAGVDHEFYDARGVLFIFSFYNTLADLKRFERACRQVKPLLLASPGFLPRAAIGMNDPELAVTPREAHYAAHERVEVGAAQGRVAAELIATCPPGWPVLIPGEVVGPWHASTLGESYLIDVVKL